MIQPRGQGGHSLSDEQLGLLELLADDKSPADIAQMLDQSIEHVETDLDRLLTELGAMSLGQAVAIAITEGLIGPYRSR